MELSYTGNDRIFIFGAAAARDLGLTVAIMVELTADGNVKKSTLTSHPLYEQYFSSGAFGLDIQESPWISMDKDTDPVFQKNSALSNRKNVHLRKGCHSVLTTIVATPQKMLKSCCGLTHEQIPETLLGSLDESSVGTLAAKACSDFLKIWISVDGPEKILNWAASKNPDIDWENKFAHQCDACRFMYQDTEVRDVIRKYHKEIVPDVLMRYSLRR